ncbi:MAG TPA: DUF3999 family protein [Nannocystis sp.]
MGALQGSATARAGEADATYRWRAPIEVLQAAPFVYLELPAGAYAHTLQPDLRDLKIVDALGEPVPFALRMPRERQVTADLERSATLYPLPTRPVRGGEWPSPIEVTVAGEQISVKRLAGAPPDPAGSPGWLIDLGEHAPGSPPHTLRLAWSGPPDFTASFEFETSDDLRTWLQHGRGSVMALASTSGSLRQPSLPLPRSAGRFLRLVWTEAGAPPQLTGATAISTAPRDEMPTIVGVEAPDQLVLSPTPADANMLDESSRRALIFDLGGALPVRQLDLRFTRGTVVAPVRLEARARPDEPWHSLGEQVFHRIEQGTDVRTSSPLALQTTLGQVRVVPDPRTPALDPANTKLVVQARLATAIFATRGEPPFTLYAGSSTAAPGALPEVALIPEGEEDRVLFGVATLGPWIEVDDATRHCAQLRPWILWAVLLAGVGGLAWMVRRLIRGSR